MTYTSIMVAVDPVAPAAGAVRLAGHVADDFAARLIGVAGEAPGYMTLPSEPVAMGLYSLSDMQEAALEKLAGAHAVFREAAGQRRRIAWFSDLDFPLAFLARHAVSADLIVVGRQSAVEATTAPGSLDLGGVILQLGRPVLIVPPGVERLEGRRVAIGWKNTREGRRAVWDAVPFLSRASRVDVISVDEGAGADDGRSVIGYLEERGIPATAVVVDAAGDGTAAALIEAACEGAADLIVTGAYGHSRLREWAFGGVTRDLLAGAPVCCLMSH